MATDEDFQNALSAAASSQFNGTNFPAPTPEPSGPGAFGIPGVSGVPGSPGGPPRGHGFFAGLNDVLTKISQSQKQKNEEIAQQQKLLQLTDERKAQQQRIDLEHERLEQEAATRDLNLKAAAAVNQAHAQEMKMQATKIMSDIAARPTSETAALPGVTNLGGGPANSDTVDLNIPGLGVMHLPTDEKRNRDLAARVTAAQDPLEANRLKLQVAKEQADAERAAANKVADQAREDSILKTNERIQAAHDTARITAASIRQKSEHPIDESLVTAHAKDILNGDTSLETLAKLPISKENKQAIETSVTAAGGKLPSQKQLDSVTLFAPLQNTFAAIDEYNQLLKDHSTAIRIPGNDFYRRANSLQKEIELTLPNIARVIATDTGRLSNQQIQMAAGAVEPTKNLLTSDAKSNLDKRNDFLKVVHQDIDARLSGLPEFQQTAIKKRLGVMNIPFTGDTPRQGAATQPSTSGTTPRIIVHDASGKVVGAP